MTQQQYIEEDATMFAAHTKHRGNRRGATLLLIVLLMTFLVAMVAFAVDVGRMYVVRAQLQGAVDSGALAATLQLKQDSDDVDAAVNAARQFVQKNRVGWLTTVPQDAITVEAGTWDDETEVFSLGGDEPNAVRVAASTANEPLFFSSVMGHSKFSVPRAAVAASGTKESDIMLVLDLSGSMADNGRIEALRSAAPVFVDVIEEYGGEDQIGMMGYGAIPDQYNPAARGHSGSLYLSAPLNQYPSNSDWVGVLERSLTDNFDSLRNSTLSSSSLIADKYNSYTPTGAAIRDAAHYLDNNARDDAEKFMVLMSDGLANRPNNSGPSYARQMANYAKGLDVKIHTISLGDGADVDLMQDIATITGGTHFDATGTGQSELTQKLTDAFKSVAAAIKRTQLVK